MEQPHKPYIKAYLIWHVLTGIMIFVAAIPIIGFGWLVLAIIGEEREILRPMIPWLRSILGFVLGYFVFRNVVRKEFLPQPPAINNKDENTEPSP